MASVTSLTASVHQRLATALTAALPEADADPLLRRSDRADYQANGILALAKKAKANPRELAAQVVAQVESGEVIKEIEVSGPGFLNITLTDRAITENLAERYADPENRLGVPLAAHPGTTVIDYAQPNVAKEMHVGHLRSAVIGDAVVQILEFTGENVVRRHHIGDWGTQFGMLIQYLDEHPHELDHKDARVSGEEAMSNLDRLYKAARKLFDSDEEFKTRARRRVVDLQAGDPHTLATWQKFVDESKIYFFSVFEKLDMEIRDADIVGESGYNDMLDETCRLLEESGVAVRSEGALCVFFDDIKGPDGNPVPLIVKKSDGGYGYAATDLSAIRDRVFNLKANSLLYVVDARQSLHFKMVFETARRAGWLNDEDVKAFQLAFGTVLGKDGKPFKTREGETIRLVDLLDEAIDRATTVVREKAEKMGLTEEEIAENGRYVGVGAVKYADLSTSAVRDYKFDLDQMVSLNGDTSVYLQYAYARIQSILRKAGEAAAPTAHPELELAPAERALGLHLDQFGETLAEVAESYEPHKLAAYLFKLATLLTTFYDQCPVLKAETPAKVENRLFLVDLTARTLHRGMGLLGIRTPDKL
ncbi:arginine--tRNA ligase [Streptomyces europaeiscabiei]|uniref:Arginine--tRNA ligase n=1 Tax=Streptomyces europaeiscabiei TaxID=146819 RepID=A0ABU4NZ69_9ACTN|nr:arginine--tRNA ligase [Streptomyces europaeiscabiei]MDX2766138.1 arginine--tRNA ligase [Streptomyces europaeiscabiei]MDX2775351.1 arginine--tRNA ligase [Streptomyces europaeiscabiei]MDX3549906.1 arginine--tRNA ligase [Streptomyces europaeiscabiei]MDX3559143.1 arginine--tRNA ligase [Streptomyces europaeiscabiei]MDX3707177.1 arginine--tRNA ligase [Streptomyces europaeiscabiei]